MNVVAGVIETITTHGNLSIVQVKAKDVVLSAIVIDTPNTCSYLREEHPIKAIFKETEVIIGRGHQHAMSLQNQLRGHVRSIESSELLSKVVVQTAIGPITSIITTRAVQQLELTEEAAVTAMIKTNEVMLSE